MGSISSIDAALAHSRYTTNNYAYKGYNDVFAQVPWNSYYLLRMQALFVPFVTGTYYFKLVGRNYAQLRLSTDTTEENLETIITESSWRHITTAGLDSYGFDLENRYASKLYAYLTPKQTP